MVQLVELYIANYSFIYLIVGVKLWQIQEAGHS